MTQTNSRITKAYRIIAEAKENTGSLLETLTESIRKQGYELTREAVAAAIRCKAWDGRIDPRNAEWANTITGEGGEGVYLPGIDKIHPANLDQIAHYLRQHPELEPTESPTEATEAQEDTETAEDTAPSESVENAPTDEAQEPTTAELVAAIAEEVEKTPTRSAWSRGVKEYAAELLEIDPAYYEPYEITGKRFESVLLNGAPSWNDYSWGGCSLIYDCDIAERLCNPSELKKTDGGRKDPNPREQWLDTQARALYQAARLVCSARDAVLARLAG